MSRTRIQWRMAILGATGFVALAIAWLALPRGAPAADQTRRQSLVDVHRALCHEEPERLDRARERLLRAVPRDLLGRHLPAALRVVDGLQRLTPACDPARGSPAQRGLCLLRRRHYAAAVVAFSEVPSDQGGAGYREVSAQLLRLHRDHGSRGRKAP